MGWVGWGVGARQGARSARDGVERDQRSEALDHRPTGDLPAVLLCSLFHCGERCTDLTFLVQHALIPHARSSFAPARMWSAHPGTHSPDVSIT